MQEVQPAGIAAAANTRQSACGWRGRVRNWSDVGVWADVTQRVGRGSGAAVAVGCGVGLVARGVARQRTGCGTTLASSAEYQEWLSVMAAGRVRFWQGRGFPSYRRDFLIADS